MTDRGSSATRYELVRARRRLERVRRGQDLLARKRRALVAELFRLARPAADARARLEDRAESAYPALLDALAATGREGARTLGWPFRELEVSLRSGSLWGVGVAEVVEAPGVARTAAARSAAPALSGPATARAAAEFEAFVDLLLDTASREGQIRRVAAALARTSRQVNTLERRVEPELERRIRGMSRVLDEREREERARLKMLLRRAAAHGPGRRGWVGFSPTES